MYLELVTKRETQKLRITIEGNAVVMTKNNRTERVVKESRENAEKHFSLVVKKLGNIGWREIKCKDQMTLEEAQEFCRWFPDVHENMPIYVRTRDSNEKEGLCVYLPSYIGFDFFYADCDEDGKYSIKSCEKMMKDAVASIQGSHNWDEMVL